MDNIVQCKRCGVDFHYSPGFAGNARQCCDKCCVEIDNEEIEEFKEKLIKESNKLNKEHYDPIDILVDGNIPTFNSDLERFLCARDIGLFIRKTGFEGLEDNLLKLLDSIEDVHRMIFYQQLTLELLKSMTINEKFKKYAESQSTTPA